MSDDTIFEIKRDFIEKLAKEGKRVDGRAFDEFRPITMELNQVTVAEGIARVQIGDTVVMVGVKAAIGTPFSDRPGNGVLMTTAELRPIASPEFEIGPPRPNSIALARVVDRGIRESKMIDLKKLCISPGEKVWMLMGDILILDYCGNLFDAAALGLVGALKNAVIPAASFDELEKDFKVETNETPISITVVKIGDSILVDPSLDEEKVSSARLTISTDSKGNVRAMQKGFAGRFTSEEIDSIVELAIRKGEEIRKQFFS